MKNNIKKDRTNLNNLLLSQNDMETTEATILANDLNSLQQQHQQQQQQQQQQQHQQQQQQIQQQQLQQVQIKEDVWQTLTDGIDSAGEYMDATTSSKNTVFKFS
jgi:transcription initiation factor TFIID subunit TAF12